MKSIPTMFLLAGLVAGALIAFGGLLSPAFLILGMAPLFLVSIAIPIAVTGAWRYLRRDVWRYVAAAILCIACYLLALLTFSVVTGYSPHAFGIPKSDDITQFRADVWLGLVASSIVTAAGAGLIVTLVTGRWTNRLFFRLLVAGFATIALTFLANLPFHQFLSFIGVMFPVGETLFCWLVGAEIWKITQQAAPEQSE